MYALDIYRVNSISDDNSVNICYYQNDEMQNKCSRSANNIRRIATQFKRNK